MNLTFSIVCDANEDRRLYALLATPVTYFDELGIIAGLVAAGVELAFGAELS